MDSGRNVVFANQILDEKLNELKLGVSELYSANKNVNMKAGKYITVIKSIYEHLVWAQEGLEELVDTLDEGYEEGLDELVDEIRKREQLFKSLIPTIMIQRINLNR